MDPLVLVRGHLASTKQPRSTAMRHRVLFIVGSLWGSVDGAHRQAALRLTLLCEASSALQA